MKEKLNQWIEKKGIEKWFQRDNLIILILSGVLLLIIALPVNHTSDKEEKNKSKNNLEMVENDMFGLNTVQSAKSESAVSKETSEENSQRILKEYEEMLEMRLKEILAGMAGAGKVEVMITFQSTQEVVVEKDRPISRSNTTEEDAQGGIRNIYETDSKENTVYKTDGNVNEPYVVKTLMPKVEGVLVAAQGAGSGEVTKNITEAVQALFDLEAHKIKVIRMKEAS